MQRYASLRQGLVGCWCPSVSGPFGYRLPDLSGYGNHGTLTNFAMSGTSSNWVGSSGKIAIACDGIDDYVEFDGTKSLNIKGNAITLSVWANPTAIDDYDLLFGKEHTSAATPFQLWAIFSGGTGGANFDRRVVAAITTDDSIRTLIEIETSQTLVGKWQHYSVTYDGSNIYLRLNGMLLNKTAKSGNLLTNSEPIRVARSKIFGNEKYSGQLDDIRIYNRALSESEIRLLASGRGVGLIPERNARRYYQPPQQPRNRSSRFLSFPA